MLYFGRGTAKDLAKAKEVCKEATEGGNANAQAFYALSLIEPRGDVTEGFKLCKKSAESGNSWGQLALGIYYAKGLSVDKDEKKAFELVKKIFGQWKSYGSSSFSGAIQYGFRG